MFLWMQCLHVLIIHWNKLLIAGHHIFKIFKNISTFKYLFLQHDESHSP